PNAYLKLHAVWQTGVIAVRGDCLMRTYVVTRLLLIVPTLLGVASLVFVIMRVIPGDVTLLILGGDQAGRIDASQIAALKHRPGIDQPLLTQFGTWLWAGPASTSAPRSCPAGPALRHRRSRFPWSSSLPL